MASQPIEILFSYANEDEAMRVKLENHFKAFEREGLIKIWHRNLVFPGQETSSEIVQHIRSADIILLLVSPNYLASDSIWALEIPQAIEQHQNHRTYVIPILLRSCMWSSSPLGKFQALPRNGQPVQGWSNEDAALFDIATEVGRIAKSLVSEQEAVHKPAEEKSSETVYSKTLSSPHSNTLPKLQSAYKTSTHTERPKKTSYAFLLRQRWLLSIVLFALVIIGVAFARWGFQQQSYFSELIRHYELNVISNSTEKIVISSLEGEPWPELERWLLNSDTNLSVVVEEMQDELRNLEKGTEHWTLDFRTLSENAGYTLNIFFYWKGSLYATKRCRLVPSEVLPDRSKPQTTSITCSESILK